MGIGSESGDPQALAGQLIEDDALVSLAELCLRCGVPADAITTLVDEGVIEPSDRSHMQWTFTATSVLRVATALRLQRDLDINLSGVALALELLDRIEVLEMQLRSR